MATGEAEALMAISARVGEALGQAGEALVVVVAVVPSGALVVADLVVAGQVGPGNFQNPTLLND